MTPFAAVADASAAVGATRSRLAKVAVLGDLIGRLQDDEVAPVVAWLCGEARQGRIGVGWATIGSVVEWAADRSDTRQGAPRIGAPLTGTDVDRAFEKLAHLSGADSVAARVYMLRALFDLATPAESGFLARLLIGEVRHGALEGVVADAVARSHDIPLDAVRRAAMLVGELPTVATLARLGGAQAVGDVGLRVGRPVQPMLAATSPSVASALTDATTGVNAGLVSVEWKLDGARIQAHRDGDDVALFTRNLNDITPRLPGIVTVIRSLPATSLVLDGEVIGLADDNSPDPFQDTMSRFSSETAVAPGQTSGGLVARFFDCLHADGDDLLDRPLSDRLAALDAVAGPHAMPRLVTADTDAAEAFAADAIARHHEGVMVKALASPYEAGRRGGSWRKVKPVIALDLVVLAAEWGHGRRQGWLSNLHLGARAVDPDDGFVMVGKTFKGLTDRLLAWQTAELLARSFRENDGTVFVRPELVVEIAIDGVQRSARYPGGVALRFARVRRYRDDKTAAEADLITVVQSLGSRP